ncbi:hypothetical protein GW758_04235 [Candidatus Falkowbacteria bacterium]|nr:hypothetical protein [Candidatus Falkowbacteria bacterium]NCT55131.1 hypothetical protein [Candidatus Falkowbacteria bacterium]
MLKKILSFSIFIIALSIVALFQISLPPVWVGFLSEVNLIPLIIVALFFFYNVKTALLAVLIFGFWLDLFSFSFFGLESISLMLSLFLIDRISFSFLTNRSLYSFLINNILYFSFYSFFTALFFYFSNFESSGFFLFQGRFWLSLIFRLTWALIISLISFSFFSALTKNLRPVFLEKR